MVYASGHEPAIALALVGEPIIISLEVFLGYAGRALMTTKPTKKKKKKSLLHKLASLHPLLSF